MKTHSSSDKQNPADTGTDCRPIDELLAIMARLRDPDGGCPWDLRQDFASIAPYTIEEAYEVDDAIRRGTMSDLQDELGDLLFQVVFHAQMAKEADAFDFDDVVGNIVAKMIHRHPHVFGDKAKGKDQDVFHPDEVAELWEQRKKAERRRRQEGSGPARVLDGVTLGLPALMRAQKLQKRAAKVGFDWHRVAEIFTKLEEEIDELKTEIERADAQGMAEEFGDLLFTAVCIGRRLGIDCETALRAANAKFERRFNAVEDELRRTDTAIEQASLEQMGRAWDQVKAAEKSS
jgi:ATP diphosphatase